MRPGLSTSTITCPGPSASCAGPTSSVPFGPNAAGHLRRTSSFSNCPDLLINSFYDAGTDEGAAFEEQAAFHGGLGGKQSHPFVLAPTAFPGPSEPLIGAESIYHLFKSWLDVVQTTPDGD